MVSEDILRTEHQAVLQKIKEAQEELQAIELLMQRRGLDISDNSAYSETSEQVPASNTDLATGYDSLQKASRAALRRNRNPRSLTEIQDFVYQLLLKGGDVRPLSDIEDAITSAGYSIPGEGKKANLVQELVGKAPDTFVRLGHGEYGLSQWVRLAAEEIIKKNPGGTTGLIALAPELQARGLLPHGTYSKENLVQILTGEGSIMLTEDERGILEFKIKE